MKFRCQILSILWKVVVLPWWNDDFYKTDVVATDPKNQQKVIDLGAQNDETIVKKYEISSLKMCCFLNSNFEGFEVENDLILGPIWGLIK